MKNYRRILAPVELHLQRDTYLIEKAKKIADSHQAKLYLLHAVEHSGNYAAYEAPISIDIEDLLMADAVKKMELYGKSVSPKNHIVKVGVASQVILEEAETLNIDLIVLGRHKNAGLRFLLGSTANSVVNHSKVDVLAIHFLASSAK